MNIAILIIISLSIIVILLILANLAQLFLHQREKKDLFDRFMSIDFREYKYMKEQLPMELDERKKEREEKRKEKTQTLNEEERKRREEARQY